MRYDGIIQQHHHLYDIDSGDITDYFDVDLDSLLSDYFIKRGIPGLSKDEIKLQINGKKTRKKKK